MKKTLKTAIGNLATNLGKHAVGKSIALGMYEPKIPEKLKEEKVIQRGADKK